MKIIYNNYLPIKGFLAINLFGILFVRNEYKYKMNLQQYKEKVLNHESIHTEQMKDFAYILPKCLQTYIGGIVFYICYVFEWLFRVLFTKDMFSHLAYKHISFEKEAFNNESNLAYLNNRKRFAQWK